MRQRCVIAPEQKDYDYGRPATVGSENPHGAGMCAYRSPSIVSARTTTNIPLRNVEDDLAGKHRRRFFTEPWPEIKNRLRCLEMAVLLRGAHAPRLTVALSREAVDIQLGRRNPGRHR